MVIFDELSKRQYYPKLNDNIILIKSIDTCKREANSEINTSTISSFRRALSGSHITVSDEDLSKVLHIQHRFDVWHKSRKIALLISQEGKKKETKDLMPWVAPIRNHFWWCCNQSNGSPEKMMVISALLRLNILYLI